MRIKTFVAPPAEQPAPTFPALYTDKVERLILFTTPYTGLILRRGKYTTSPPFDFFAEVGTVTLNRPVDAVSTFRRFDGSVTLSNN